MPHQSPQVSGPSFSVRTTLRGRFRVRLFRFLRLTPLLDLLLTHRPHAGGSETNAGLSQANLVQNQFVDFPVDNPFSSSTSGRHPRHHKCERGPLTLPAAGLQPSPYRRGRRNGRIVLNASLGLSNLQRRRAFGSGKHHVRVVIKYDFTTGANSTAPADIFLYPGQSSSQRS